MKKLLINLSLVLISLLVVFTVVEVALRVFKIYQPRGQKLLTEYDSLLGWKLTPKARGLHKTEEYQVIEEINSKGLRGPEIPYEKERGQWRLLLLGDSFVEGYMVELENHFSQIMQKALQSEGIDTEVICGGVGGYSTDQELLFYESEGKKYHPDVTVLMFYDNDVWYNIQPNYWRGSKPLFKLDEGALILTNVPLPKPMEYKGLRPKLRKIGDYIIINSALYYYYKIGSNKLLANNLFGRKKPLNAKQVASKLSDDFGVFARNYPPDIRYAWRVTEAIIIRLKKEVQANKSKLLVCYIPNSSSIYGNQWEDTKKTYGFSDDEFDVNQIGKELTVICRRNAIDYLNLTEPLRGEARQLEPQGKRLYYVKNGHWNAAGNIFVGRYLASFVREKYLNPATHAESGGPGEASGAGQLSRPREGGP